MKKFLFAIGILVAATASQAQDSKIMAGAGLNYATDIANVGVNIEGVYLINDTWEANAGFTYFFKKDYTSYSSLDFNGHYVFASNEGKCAYALAGLNVTFYKFEMDNLFEGYDGYDSPEYDYVSSYASGFETKGNEMGLNLGIGGRMPIGKALSLKGEIKYTVGGFDYLTIGAGVLYHF